MRMQFYLENVATWTTKEHAGTITNRGFTEIIQEAKANYIITTTQQEKILKLALKWIKEVAKK